MEEQKQLQTVPKSVGALVLGILSLGFSFVYGIFGIPLGIIALNLASKAKRMYKENPGIYSEGSYKMAHSGYVMGLIGLILSSVIFFIVIIVIVFLAGL